MVARHKLLSEADIQA